MVYKGKRVKASEAYLLQKLHCSLQLVINCYLIHCTKALFTLFILYIEYDLTCNVIIFF